MFLVIFKLLPGILRNIFLRSESCHQLLKCKHGVNIMFFQIPILNRLILLLSMLILLFHKYLWDFSKEFLDKPSLLFQWFQKSIRRINCNV